MVMRFVQKTKRKTKILDPIKSEEKEVSNLPPSVRKERAMLLFKKTNTKYYGIVMGLINAKF